MSRNGNIYIDPVGIDEQRVALTHANTTIELCGGCSAVVKKFAKNNVYVRSGNGGNYRRIAHLLDSGKSATDVALETRMNVRAVGIIAKKMGYRKRYVYFKP